MSASRRAASAALAVVLTALLAGCGGGFGSAPASPPERAIKHYVALGDSFTAAPGVGDTSRGDGCQRSDANYPALLASALDVTQLRDVSCVGATTAAFTTDTEPARGADEVPPQLDAVDRDTDLVTIGMGIEDRDLISNVFRICLALPCGDKVPPQTVLSDLDAMATALVSAVRSVQEHAPEAFIVLVGYPKITPVSGPCRALPDVDQPALDAANSLLREINRRVRSVAREAGAEFLDAETLSDGHELCSSDPWTEKAEKGPATYRPVAAEQRAVAEALEELVRNH